MYFPSNQITTNLYTAGNEYVVKSTKILYSGPYYKLSTGKYYSGANPKDKSSQELVLIDPQVPIIISVSDPEYFKTYPTAQDYKVGYFTRYYCKKINNNLFIEISKNTYENLIKKDPSLSVLYFPFTTPWLITGNKDKVELTNRKNILDIEEKQKLTGLSVYISDYTEFYIE
jgi:hypothetical protein